jgi:aryl-alcohol dehydrogenase-like predicted oxidoreductase
MGAMLNRRLRVEGVGKPVSQLALGTAFYGFDNRGLWFRMLDEFVEAGGTVIDTARAYGGGESEKLIGMWMQARGARDNVVLITKCGLGKHGALPEHDFTGMVAAELTQSLECLRTDCVDLYMLHRDNPSLAVAEIMECLNGELARGRVRAIGASNWQYARVDEANEYARRHGLKGFAAISNNLSLAVPTGPFYPGLVSVDAVGERWHARTATPLVSWSSQARGFFTGRYSRTPPDGVHSVADGFAKRMLEVYCTDENHERLRRAQELGESKGGYSAVQMALAWVLHRPFPVVAIVGPHTTEELASCVEAASIELTEAESRWLTAAA